MTAKTYTTITDTEIQQGKPIRALTGRALRDNVESVAGRGSGAPWLNGVGAMQVLTGSGNFTVPAGVYRIKITATGGGGGGGGTGGGGNGGNTTFGPVTANGGSGAGATNGGNGGSGSGPTGALVISGSSGHGVVGSSPANGGGGGTYWGQGPGATTGSSGITGEAIGSGGGGGESASNKRGGGGGGGTVIHIFSVEPGDVIAYQIGAGGAGAGTSGNGAAGTIIVEY